MTPALDLVMEMWVQVGEAVAIGPTAHGMRRVIPILGGRFEGPELSGTILPGGADWQLIRSDGVAELEARKTLRADDGTLVAMTNRGFRHGPAAVMARLAAGEAVDPDLYYFRSVPVFDTAGERLAWLARTVFVAAGSRDAEGVRLRIYAVR